MGYRLGKIMAKNKISEWSATPASNTDIGGINIAEGMAPSDVNNAIREMMAQIKDQQAGTDGDNFTVGGNLSVTGSTSFGALTTTGVVTITNATVTTPNGLNIDANTLVVDATNNRVGVKTASPAVGLSVGGTDAILIPVGTTAERPTGAQGYIRYNTTLNRFEGYANGAWGQLGAGATGGGADNVFVENSLTVTTDYTITAGKSASSVGDLTIDSGVTVTVPSGSRWVIL
jgi:hypothetical protein